MGRTAIDEQAIRELEANNPDVEFDWPQILRGHAAPEAVEPPRKARERAAVRPGARPESSPPPWAASETTSPVLDGEEADRVNAPVFEGPAVGPATPAEARLGSQGLARLRARYAELLTRITDRVAQPERQEELKALAERLNPDAWITDADVTAGLDAYEPSYEMVRSALPPRRKPGEPV